MRMTGSPARTDALAWAHVPCKFFMLPSVIIILLNHYYYDFSIFLALPFPFFFYLDPDLNVIFVALSTAPRGCCLQDLITLLFEYCLQFSSLKLVL